ncbi:MAG: histidine phosphatase family protein [Turicibacter sp.]
MSKIILYLIRHGKTECNEQRLYCGVSDVSLSELGREELYAKCNTVTYPQSTLNFTSGAKRANETFEILYPNTIYEVNHSFWEYDFGEFELKSYEMLKSDSRYIDWITDDTLMVSCPGGQSRQDYRTRLSQGFLAFIEKLKTNHQHEALIVCHGGTIGTLLQLFYDEGKDLFSYQPACGGGYKVSVSQTDAIKIEILEKW